MIRSDIARARLQNQGITEPAQKKADEVVHWLGAVQAQNYTGAKWALGMRIQATRDEDIDRAYGDGSILRTHLLRPTWHFVTPADIRWMLTLTAPRVHTVNAYMYRKQGLDNAVFERSNAALEKALRGGQHLTRDELRNVLQQAGIATDDGLRMSYLMMFAELEGIICSGPRRGKQFTYALLDERAPQAGNLAHEEALAELARRYFASRGPATVQDFAKWSGLTVADAVGGLEAVKDQLQQEVVEGQPYWFSMLKPGGTDASPIAHLLSIYDEYISGYKDRSAMVDKEVGEKLIAMGNALSYILVLDGQIVGTARRTIKKDAVILETNIMKQLTKVENQAIAAAAQQYGEFLGLPAALLQV